MASTQAKRLYRVIRELGRASRVLKKSSGHLHLGRRIAAAEYGVLERLAAFGPQTVPAMARARGCSRQHIQARVDSLLAGGMVRVAPNPAHRKSSLIALTESGSELFETISRVEEAAIERLAERFAAKDLAVTARTVAALSAALEEMTEPSLK